MSDRIHVHPAELFGAAGTFYTAIDELSSGLSDARATLGGLGDVCGNDDQGRQFAASYQPQADKVLQAAANLLRGLSSIPEGLEANAANYHESDAGNSRRFQVK
jgi:uncharacterized protein YukE